MILAQDDSFQYWFFQLLRFTPFAEVGLEFLGLSDSISECEC